MPMKITMKLEVDECSVCADHIPDMPSAISYEGENLQLVVMALQSFLPGGTARVLCPACYDTRAAVDEALGKGSNR